MEVFRGRRANGDTVETNTSSRRRVSSPWHGIQVDIDDVLQITTTWGSGGRELPFNDPDCRLGDSRGKPLRPEDQRVILGFKVVREVSADPLGSDESWMAAELGCLDLERKTRFFRNGAAAGYKLYIPIRAVAAAPKSSLFAIPDGAREMTDSEYFAVFAKSPTRARDPNVQARDDDLYVMLQARRKARGVTLDVFKRTGR
jgi:hypothetical protein